MCNEAEPEAAVVRRAQSGDVAAFTELYRRHSRWVFGVALRIVGNAADAEDITQDTFIQAWKALARFRHDSELRTWIHRICVNRCLRVAAKRSGTRTDELPHDLVSTSPDPATVAALRDEMAEVQRAIASLPAGQRAALVLREFGGLSYEEVATVLGISLTAARTRIHRGRLEVVSRLGRPRSAGAAPTPRGSQPQEASA